MKILLADDHPLFRDGVRHVLGQLGAHVEIVDAPDFPGVFRIAAEHPDLDLALVDLYMPGMPGQEAVAAFRQQFPEIPLVVLTASESVQDMKAVAGAGASGYILKSYPAPLMLDALVSVLSGGMFFPEAPPLTGEEAARSESGKIGLTTRQRQVLALLAEGKPNKVIARALQLTEGTVKIHVAAIFRALEVSNRTEAVIAARRLGLAMPENDRPYPGRHA